LFLAGLAAPPAARLLAADAETLPPLAQYSIDTWDGAGGLPQIRIRAIVQTRDGYLWLGTANGLVRFDGVSFTTFGINTSSLKDNEISSLVEDNEGALWIGTYGGGLTRFTAGQFTTFTTADGLPDNSIRKVDKDLLGNIWFATPRGVGRYSKGKFSAYTTRDGLPGNFISSICAGSPQGLFAVAGGKLNRLANGKFVTETAAVGEDDGRVDSMTCGPDGAVWMTFESSRIKCWKDGRATTYREADLKGHRPGAIYPDPQGTFWIATRDGLVRFHDGAFEALTTPQARAKLGLVQSIFADHEGNLWLGTEANGLARLRIVAVRMLTAEDGLSESSTRCVYRDRRGDIWIGAYLGFSRLSQGKLTAFNQIDGNPLTTVTSIGEDLQGRIWLAIGGKLFIRDSERLVPVPGWSAVFDIKVIARDQQGDMWIGTDGDGLFRVSNGAITSYRTKDGLPNNQVRAVLSDRHGALWVGTTAGLARLQNGKFTTFGTSDGLANSRITSIYEDADGILWLGTRGGLIRLQGGRFFNIRETEGLPNNYIFNVLDDGQGNFWLGSAKGIGRVRKADLDALSAGKISKVQVASLGYREGLRTASLVAGTQPNASIGPAGQLLFCSLNGLVQVSPMKEKTNSLVPPVYLEQVSINKQIMPVDRPPELPPGPCEIEIHYTALSYVAPEKVLFKYRLEGVDDRWVEAGQRRFANYASLPPGSYRFQVIACNNDGIWNQTGASYSFRVPPRFYQTAWFAGLTLLLFAGLAGGAYALKIQRLQAHERELQRRVDEAVAQVKVLHGLLPICMGCKKIRDDKGYWNQIENYIARHADIKFSHSLCPDCLKTFYPDVADQVLSEMNAAKPSETPK
jgi:ligand-binding sensor domain-containing protein